MLKKLTLIAAAVGVVAFTGQAVAGKAITGNGTPSGPHYTLNIIGVENPKKSTMTGSNRHSIFVALYSKPAKHGGKNIFSIDGTAIVDSKIWLTPGEDFTVCDGNGFDEAYGCDNGFDETWNGVFFDENGDPAGTLVDRKMGAVFMLPCNTNLTDSEDSLTACDIQETAHYSVWIKPLGGPGGTATITTCATADDGDGTDVLVCSTENVVLVREKGNKLYKDVTDELTSIVVTLCDGVIIGDPLDCEGTLTIERIALFAGDTEDWFWNYDNKGLRLAQLRFYEVPQ